MFNVLFDMCMVVDSEISSRALHIGAMAVCMEPPMIERGDWLKTFGRPTSVRLKFYTDAPPNGREIPLPIPFGPELLHWASPWGSKVWRVPDSRSATSSYWSAGFLQHLDLLSPFTETLAAYSFL